MEINYLYLRGNYPYGNVADLGNNFSRHHIIAYPNMYAIGAIVLAYFRILDMEYANYKVKDFFLSNDYQKFETYYRTIYYDADGRRGETGISKNEVDNAMKTVREQHGKAADTRICLYDSWAKGVLNKMAWTKNNLFIGPTAKFRCDDPEQECDCLPLSMKGTDFVQWLYEAVYNRYLRTNTEIARTANAQGRIILETDIIKAIGHEFIARLPYTPREYETKVEDWRVVCCDKRGNRIGPDVNYNIYFEKNAQKYTGEPSDTDYLDKLRKIEYWKLELVKDSASHSAPVRQTDPKMTAVLFGIRREGVDVYLQGILGGNGPEREAQQKLDITGVMNEMPWLA